MNRLEIVLSNHKHGLGLVVQRNLSRLGRGHAERGLWVDGAVGKSSIHSFRSAEIAILCLFRLCG